MKIRHKLFIYYGVLLTVSFGIAAIITSVFIRSGLNRLVFSNVSYLNHNIVNELELTDGTSFLETLDNAIQFTGADLIVLQDGEYFYSSFVNETVDLTSSYLVSAKYDVYRVKTDVQTYYFTSSMIHDSDYEIFLFRGEGTWAEENQQIYLTSFVGIVFLVISITAISLVSASSFANPLRILSTYASSLSVDSKPKKRPEFKITEFDELAQTIQRTHRRIYEYNQNEQEFLHNFSHEMKTPLTNIYGYAEAMLYGVLSEEEGQNACQVIMNESEKLKDLINQILYLGRLDTLQNEFLFSKINLIDVINDALNSVEIQIIEKKLQVQFSNNEDNIYVLGDADKLEVAFVNLLTNAIRYATEKITIRVEKDKNDILVFFDDDGMGIDASIQDKIWDRYFVGKEGHSGLGLTITKSIIEKHGGLIEARNNPKGGARFEIRFRF